MTRFTVGPPAGDAEVLAFVPIARQAFGFTDDAAVRAWFERGGLQNLRVVREGATVVGGLVLLPMGQFFGGRSVPMNGIQAVAIAPEHRARGAATALMRETVLELRRDGFAISSLYPATQPLYRSVGYERAGAEYRVSVPAKAMDVADRTLSLRRATADDESAMKVCYLHRARAGNGNLNRNAATWEWVFRPLGRQVQAFVVEGERFADGFEGYVVYSTREMPEGGQAYFCPDVVATTPAAARRIVTFFGDHRSMAGEVAWRGSPADPVLAVMREQYASSAKLSNVWMLRVLDVPAALTKRGYGPVTAEVHLEVTDALVPENAGRWTLHVSGGAAEVARGGRGSVRLDVRGLAPLYTGFQSAAELRASGLADGTDEDLAAATAVFAGPQPWLADHF